MYLGGQGGILRAIQPHGAQDPPASLAEGAGTQDPILFDIRYIIGRWTYSRIQGFEPLLAPYNGGHIRVVMVNLPRPARLIGVLRPAAIL